MSIAHCITCGHLVDTDDEPEFYDFSYRSKTGYDGHCFDCQGEMLEAMTEAEQEQTKRGLMDIEQAINTLKRELSPEIYQQFRPQLDELEHSIAVENMEAVRTERKNEAYHQIR